MGLVLGRLDTKIHGENIMEAIRAFPMTDNVIPHTAETVLGAIQPPEAAAQALAKLAVLRSLRYEFSEPSLVTMCRPPKPGRTWSGLVRDAFKRSHGNTDGFSIADLETEAVMLDVDELIWPLENAA